MTVLTPQRLTGPDELDNLELLIREARRRQRRRRLILTLILLAGLLGYLVTRTPAHPTRATSPIAHSTHSPSPGPARRCPVSSGVAFNNSDFNGIALGSGPVRVLIANAGDVLHGRPKLGTTGAPGWFALQTIWFAMPGYNGPFIVRAARVGAKGPIEVQPGGTGLTQGSGPLVVPAGPTVDTFADGYRTQPSSTWVKSPGCYAWQVHGGGFSESIVFQALSPGK
jgi:hypothetical protein